MRSPMRGRSSCFVLLPLFLVVCCVGPSHAQRLGILFGSFGDVESCQCVNSYFKGALQRLVGYEIPVHDEIERVAIADLVWSVSKKETFDMCVCPAPPAACCGILCHLFTRLQILICCRGRYTSISPQCNTSFITRSAAQSDAVAQQVPGSDSRPETTVTATDIWLCRCVRWAWMPKRTPPTTL